MIFNYNYLQLCMLILYIFYLNYKKYTIFFELESKSTQFLLFLMGKIGLVTELFGLRPFPMHESRSLTKVRLYTLLYFSRFILKSSLLVSLGKTF